MEAKLPQHVKHTLDHGLERDLTPIHRYSNKLRSSWEDGDNRLMKVQTPDRRI
ncbi:hypothetical protein [Sphingobacterium sp. BS-2]|uniref:hypothetical protein n=1 Tax=Sphingobacterium sp. BS-2 TaxID=3377129 RepID=UPI0038FC240D